MRKYSIKVLLFIMFLFIAQKVDADIISSGTCGMGCSYTLDDDGTMIISGNGIIENYFQSHLNDSSELKELIIEEGIHGIGTYAFANCNNLTKVSLSDSIESIGSYAFYCCNRLVDISFPQKNLSFDVHAFHGCSALTKISIPEGVETIPAYTFYECSSLTEVILPDSLQYINADAFFNCIFIESILIPDNLVSISRDSFYSNTKLIVSSVSSQSAKTISAVGLSFRLPGDKFSLKYEILGEQTSLKIVSCDPNVTNLTIPDYVDTIGYEAFLGHKLLENITIPSNVTSIERYAFCNCTKLRQITIPGSIKSIGTNVFGGSRVENVVLSEGVQHVATDAFSGCSNLLSIDVPDTITSIDYNAFPTGVSLYVNSFESNTAKVLSASGRSFRVKSLESIAFGASYIYRKKDGKDYLELNNAWGDSEFIIPDGVNSIGQYAFSSTGITSLIVPDSVTDLGQASFSGSKNLQYIILPDHLDRFEAFFSHLYTPILYTSIGSKTAKAISKAGYPFRVIGTNYSLQYTFSSDEISGLELISCDDSTDIDVLEGITSIRPNAFTKCSRLKNITLPESLTKIANGTFVYCDNLEKVEIKGYTMELGDRIISDVSPNILCHVFSDVDKWATPKGYSVSYYETLDVSFLFSPDNLPHDVLNLLPASTIYINRFEETINDLLPVGTSIDLPEYEYVFEGFDIQNRLINHDSVQYIGHWKCLPKYYSITFETDGGTLIDPIILDYGANIVLPNTIPTKAGYTFISWDKTPPLTMPSNDLVFNAIWKANTYTVIFDPNGGCGDYTSQVLTYDRKEKLIENSIERNGYVLAGWNTRPDGTGVFMHDTSLNLSTEQDARVIVYAQWVEEKDILSHPVLKKLESVPASLSGFFKSVDQIKQLLLSRIIMRNGKAPTNYELYDIELMLSINNGLTWIPASTLNFPQGGIRVVLPYPQGTGMFSHVFKVAHMFTTDFRGRHPGGIETPLVKNTEQGIDVTFDGLSPVLLGWEEVSKEETHTDLTFEGTVKWLVSGDHPVHRLRLLKNGQKQHITIATKIDENTWIHKAEDLSYGANYFAVIDTIPGYYMEYQNVGEYADIKDKLYNSGTVLVFQIPPTGDKSNITGFIVLAIGMIVCFVSVKRCFH